LRTIEGFRALQARPSDARAIAEVSVASRLWSYRDLLAEADLDALSVEETTADFAQGLAELPPGSAVSVAERGNGPAPVPLFPQRGVDRVRCMSAAGPMRG